MLQILIVMTMMITIPSTDVDDERRSLLPAVTVPGVHRRPGSSVDVTAAARVDRRRIPDYVRHGCRTGIRIFAGACVPESVFVWVGSSSRRRRVGSSCATVVLCRRRKRLVPVVRCRQIVRLTACWWRTSEHDCRILFSSRRNADGRTKIRPGSRRKKNTAPR